jgi:hypothetical protein
MALPVNYLLQDSFVLSCTADFYEQCIAELELSQDLSAIELKQLQKCHRRIRNREYAKDRRSQKRQEISAVFQELERLRAENTELRQILSQSFKIK